MKITEYLCCALACICLLKMTNAEIARNKFERQLLNALTTDKTIKQKRVYCNHFGGCFSTYREEPIKSEKTGKDFSLNTPALQDSQGSNIIDYFQFPISLYHLLFKIAKQLYTPNMIDREEHDYRSQGIPQIYPPDQTALRLETNSID